MYNIKLTKCAPVECDVRPYVRVYIGDGTWYDTQNPPKKIYRVIGFVFVLTITIWPLTLSFLLLALFY